jgi:tRNA(Ile2) C34 agmatinyltransferase TiaS
LRRISVDSDRKLRDPEPESYLCQFCGRESASRDWKNDKCPECGRKYDAALAREEDDG